MLKNDFPINQPLTIVIFKIENQQLFFYFKNDEKKTPVSLPLFFEEKQYPNFDKHDFEIESTITKRLNPLEGDYYYADLKHRDYILKADWSAIYHAKLATQELNVPGVHKIRFKGISLFPIKGFYNQHSNIEIETSKYPGLKVDYEFSEIQAKPSSFYLPLFPNKFIESEEVAKGLVKMHSLLANLHVKDEEMRQLVSDFTNPEKLSGDFAEFSKFYMEFFRKLDQKCKTKDYFGFIKAFFNQQNKIVKYFISNAEASETKRIDFDAIVENPFDWNTLHAKIERAFNKDNKSKINANMQNLSNHVETTTNEKVTTTFFDPQKRDSLGENNNFAKKSSTFPRSNRPTSASVWRKIENFGSRFEVLNEMGFEQRQLVFRKMNLTPEEINLANQRFNRSINDKWIRGDREENNFEPANEDEYNFEDIFAGGK